MAQVISHGKPLLLTGKTLCNISLTCNFTTTPSALTGCWIFLTDQRRQSPSHLFPKWKHKEWDSEKHFGIRWQCCGGLRGCFARVGFWRGGYQWWWRWFEIHRPTRKGLASINAQKVTVEDARKAGLYCEPWLIIALAFLIVMTEQD